MITKVKKIETIHVATCLELASKKGGFVTLFSFSLHSNVDISVKWIGMVMKVVLF